ncbi:MAG: lipoprotein insertase outer membrane protein LolB [Pseudohongiellaceae bacterium]
MTHHLHLNLFILVIAITLSACRSYTPVTETAAWELRRERLLAMDRWDMRGRVNARYQGDSDTATINWEQRGRQYVIRLHGTLNAGATRIEGRPGFVTLEASSGEILQADSPEQLILDQVGYELPVSELNFWIKGIPTPGEPRRLELDEFNQLVSLSQAGWEIRYEAYAMFGAVSLPVRLEMSRPDEDIRLTFFRLDWDAP